MDGLAAVALGVYLAAVLLNGNLSAFLGEVKKEVGFLEFIVALFIVYQLTKVPAIRPVTIPLVGAAGLIMAFRVINGSDGQAFNQFAQGRIGLFELFGRVFTNQR
jgi:hypothetical protein